MNGDSLSIDEMALLAFCFKFKNPLSLQLLYRSAYNLIWGQLNLHFWAETTGCISNEE